MAYLPLSTANLPNPAIDPAQDVEPRDYFETFLYTGNGAGLQVGDVIKKPADTITIANSVILDGSNEYFSRTVQSGGSTSEWTISFWFKDAGGILGSDTILGNTDNVIVYFNSSNSYRMTFFMGNSSSQWVMNRLPKDDGMWHHVVLNYDSARSSSDLMRVWFDGVQDSWYSTQVVSAHFTGDGTLSLGARGDGSSPYSGYLAEIHMCDGNAYAASEFGTFDANGIWIPQTPSVTYGTTGFHVNFSDNTSTTTLGEDQAGSNDFTYNNGETTDQVSDSPTNNFMTMSPTDTQQTGGSLSLSEGNLRVNHDTDGHWNRMNGSFPFTNGKWYYEFQIKTVPTGTTTNWGVGFREFEHSLYYSMNDGFEDSGDYSYSLDASTAKIVADQDRSDGSTSGITAAVADDYINIAIEKTDGNIKAWFGINGTWFNSGNPATGANPAVDNESYAKSLIPTVAFYAYPASTNGNGIFNFGQKTFNNTIPSGFTGISENNITVDDQNLESPDLVWIKSRGAARHHGIWDSVRGAGKLLQSSSTDLETDRPYGVTSFNKNGFTLGPEDPSWHYNEAGIDEVAWCWKAGTSVSGSTSGLGTSQSYTGSVSTISGFGIIGYEGNNTAGHEIPHHLDSAPEVVIVKRRTGGDNWAVTTPDVNRLYLNGSNDAASINYNWADQDGSAVTLNGSDAFMNASSNTYVMYCFHSVDGYSKFGSYTGNNSSDGPFVYTGFKPAFVMLKKSSGTGDWNIRDTARSPFNVVGQALYPNLAFSEYSGTETYIDILSNGFKLRGNWNSSNASGTYIYMAFAENPFKYSNAR